ncbi:MAG: adenine deaminase [Bdellovibrionota bacterium]
MVEKSRNYNNNSLSDAIKAAKGELECSLVIKNVQFLDVYSGGFHRGDVAVYGDSIVGTCDDYTGKQEFDASNLYLVPGFVDSHVHIESSLMTPARFQEAVLPCGTTTAIWDPHEIANVKGKAGIQWALEASEKLLMDIFVMVPSCVPSTTPSLGLESSGASLNASDIECFRKHPRVLGLAEMMNFPGLLGSDEDVLQKLIDFKDMKRDGHCPGLSGKGLSAYGVAGIHSCHESTSLAEAQEKLRKGIHVLIREGSCAKNAQELLPLLSSYTSAVLALCSDDRNPADIHEQGHINYVINLALKNGFKAEEIFRVASFAAARMYGLQDRGAIAPGFLADFCLVSKNTSGTWQDGFSIERVIKSGQVLEKSSLVQSHWEMPSYFEGKNLKLDEVNSKTFQIECRSDEKNVEVKVIEVIPNQIVTRSLNLAVTSKFLDESDGASQKVLNADPAQDVLKIAVLERHNHTGRKSVAFVRGFGLKEGAIATSINHDSHNVIVVGANDLAMAEAVNRLRAIDGGIVVVKDRQTCAELPLPIGGLMTEASPEIVTEALLKLKDLARKLGCDLHEPFLQLSFLALPVIPTLKITDRGLVDVDTFKIVPVEV